MTRRHGIAIHALLLAQIAFPLHYYLRNADHRDERFAWRMFSSTRVEKCNAQFIVNDSPIRAGSEFHNAWVGLAARGRKKIVEAMAESLCSKSPDTKVQVRILCEQNQGDASKPKGHLSNPNLKESSYDVEVVSVGLKDVCPKGAL